MDNQIRSIIDFDQADLDNSGIVVSRNGFEQADVATSKQAWEKLYNFNLEVLERDRAQFAQDKLADHVRYIERNFRFSSRSVYLEIGCGPSYIAEYLMKKFDVWFVGVDFNYELLKVLKQYFQKHGLTKYLLIHGNISSMSLKNETVDYIYGGGVIEHLADTNGVLRELYRVLKPDGLAFNSVPALDLWWLTHAWNNIPSGPLQKFFEYVHYRLLKGRILKRSFGYELSFTPAQLRAIHAKVGFREITIGPLAFHPSSKKMSIPVLRNIYFFLQQQMATAAVYYCSARK